MILFSPFQALIALVLLPICLAQVENPNDRIRKLRFRRPNSPRLVGVEDEDGAGQGPAIPLRAAGKINNLGQGNINLIESIKSRSFIYSW